MAEDITDGIIRRSRNLNLYKGLTDDEIRAKLTEKRERDAQEALVPKTNDKSYDIKYRSKLTSLQQEFAVDMNDANDGEMLQSLVRHMLQSESADEAIRAIHEKGSLNRMDFLNLKNLGEYQGQVNRTVSELQDKLGISRKLRKEKTTSDIPEWIHTARVKSKNFMDRHTTTVECPKCQIELFRYWMNFTKLSNKVSATLICWKCNETVIYSN